MNTKSKIALLACVCFATAAVSSCTNKTKPSDNAEETKELEATVVNQLDSLALCLSNIYENSMMSNLLNSDSIAITDEQRKIKPEYLLKESDITQLVNLSQKYRAYAIAMTDREIRKLYQLHGDASYTAAIDRLQMEINDDALNKMKGEGSEVLFDAETYRTFYNEMKEAGRLDYFYDATTAIAVETIYLLSNNIDLYNVRLDDSTAAAISQHLQTIYQAISLLAKHRPNLHNVALSMKPLEGINSNTAAELKQQLQSLSPQIKLIRYCLLTDEDTLKFRK